MKDCWIDGQWQQGQGTSMQSINPANNQCIWQGQEASEQQVMQATISAKKAFPSWSKLAWQERLNYLEQYVKVIDAHQDELITAICEENGKPHWEARSEVDLAAKKLEISLKAYQDRTGAHHQTNHDIIQRTRHKPLGVMAVLGPFNFPTHLPHGHILPALLAGNTVVFKPSEHTPYVGTLLAKYWQLAGLPDGVFNLVQGAKNTGQALTTSPVNGVLFTGSYETGRAIHQALAGEPEKLLALEMGGNNPLIVVDIDDVRAAALQVVLSSFISAGQRCTCARRLIVIRNSPDTPKLIDELIKVSSQLKVGSYNDEPPPFMGPVISRLAAENLLKTIQNQEGLGAISLLAAKHLKRDTGFLSPAILDVSSQKNRIDQEYFGPVLQIIQVNNFQQAIKEANNTSFGLAAGILTNDKNNYETFYEQSNAGIVNWNRQLTGASSLAPFGGTGFSGNHRPSAYYAADYCAYPVASMESSQLLMPQTLPPGVVLDE